MEIPIKIELTVATQKKDYPNDKLKEVAFVGRSNVGKSSLINTLLGKKIARTSQNPGKTRTLNFYKIEEKLYLVDLPGYGYAKAPKTEIAKWGQMTQSYLENRKNLGAIALLLDIRHPPNPNDKQMYNWLLHYNHKIIIVATKLDKIKRSQIQKHISIIRSEMQGFTGEIITFSSLDKAGMGELWETIFVHTSARF